MIKNNQIQQIRKEKQGNTLSVFLLLSFLLSCMSPLFSQSVTDSVHVAHYSVHLSVLDFDGKHVDGYAQLKIVPRMQNLTTFALDLAAFDVDSVKIDQETASFQRQTDKVILDVASTYQLGDTLEVGIYYQGVPEKDPRWGGFYFSGTYAFNMGVAMTRIPHNYGRCWYPCLDVFTDKSTYDFHITTSANNMAVCGGMLTDTTHTADGSIIWHWQLTQPVPTYLTSFAVGEYAHYSDMYQGLERNIPIDIYVPQNRLTHVSGSFANLKSILRYFENSFGAYKFDRIGYVGVNFNSGAMEHATSIAYPNTAIDGTLNSESLWIHELSHSWFGNLLTCEKAEEMWINEGFARYCEILGKEHLYETDGYSSRAKESYRSLHRSVLKNTHTTDGGYFALNAIPLEITYGSTSYDKGALIVHNLRHYLGDSQFYALMTEMLDEYAFSNISSEDFFQFLTRKSGLPMEDFYDAWVAQPGFLHFNMDSIIQTGNTDEYAVYVKQKLHHAENYGQNQKIDLTFFSTNQEEYTTTVRVSGETEHITIQIPFQPVFGVVDFHEKMSDAIVDYQEKLTTTGVKTFTDAFARVNIRQIEDSTFFRIEHHLVAPDPVRVENPDIYRISDNHYWRVLYFPKAGFDPELQFRYLTGGSTGLDADLFQGYEFEDLVLLYRKDAGEDWRIVNFSKSGNSSFSGYLIAAHSAPGEYCLAMGNSALKTDSYKGDNIFIKPNPANQQLEYSVALKKSATYLEIKDMNGRMILRKSINGNNGTLDVSSLSNGNYVLIFGNTKEKVSTKFVKNK